MIEKILEWGGIVFVVVGIVCLFWEAIVCLRRRTNPKLTIVGIVLLAISVVGYIVTELILRDMDLPVFLTAIWIAFLWAYLICNGISAVVLHRNHRSERKDDEQAKDEQPQDEQSDEKQDDEQ